MCWMTEKSWVASGSGKTHLSSKRPHRLVRPSIFLFKVQTESLRRGGGKRRGYQLRRLVPRLRMWGAIPYSPIRLHGVNRNNSALSSSSTRMPSYLTAGHDLSLPSLQPSCHSAVTTRNFTAALPQPENLHVFRSSYYDHPKYLNILIGHEHILSNSYVLTASNHLSTYLMLDDSPGPCPYSQTKLYGSNTAHCLTELSQRFMLATRRTNVDRQCINRLIAQNIPPLLDRFLFLSIQPQQVSSSNESHFCNISFKTPFKVMSPT
jgi:hypothetical protein